MLQVFCHFTLCTEIQCDCEQRFSLAVLQMTHETANGQSALRVPGLHKNQAYSFPVHSDVLSCCEKNQICLQLLHAQKYCTFGKTNAKIKRDSLRQNHLKASLCLLESVLHKAVTVNDRLNTIKPLKTTCAQLVPLSKTVAGTKALRGDHHDPFPSVHTQNNILIVLMSWHVQPVKNPS